MLSFEELMKHRSQFNPSELWQVSWHDLEYEPVSEDEEVPCPEFYERMDVFQKIAIRQFICENIEDKEVVKKVGFKFDLTQAQAEELFNWHTNTDPVTALENYVMLVKKIHNVLKSLILAINDILML